MKMAIKKFAQPQSAEPGTPFWAQRRSWRDYIGQGFVGGCAMLIGLLVYHEGMGWQGTAGVILSAGLLLYLFQRDVARYRPKFIENPGNLLLVAVLIATTLLTGRVSYLLMEGIAYGVAFLQHDAVIYGLPLASGAMLAALLIDVHTAIIVSTILSFCAALWLQDFSYPIFVFVSSISGAFKVAQCKRRSAVLRAGLYVSGASVLAGLAAALLRGEMHTAMGASILVFSMINGIAVTAVVSMALPALESAFKITTDIRLIELLDLNQPLLRNLLVHAPGTYHHSIIVGNLAEAAAEAVGANPLLARVSAYYHDIGKAKMPDYFIENQQSMVNRHEKLSTTMSSLIISSHVRDGVEMAEAQKLPEPIIDVIREHHGTSLMTYFHQKARNMHEPGAPPINEDDYRYPGPRPQTRVAAIIMMADAVEAASRVLTDPTPARISALVEKLTTRIFLEGQLDECELTLKDMQRIKERFVYILTSIFHKRIDYPGMGIDDKTDQHADTRMGSASGAAEETGTESAKGAGSLGVFKG